MIPQTVWTGADALTHAETDICVLGNKALIVAGQSMIRQGHMKRLTELLERYAILICEELAAQYKNKRNRDTISRQFS